MAENQGISFEYDEIGDVLDVYFGENRRAWTVELTDNIMISIDRLTQEAVSLTLLDFTELIRPAPIGPRSFPLSGIDNLLPDELDLVIKVLTTSPVSEVLDVSSVVSLPASPIPVMHMGRLPLEKYGFEVPVT